MAIKKSGLVQKKATYQSVHYEGQEFSSKSALIKHLLSTTSKSQVEIAQICGVTAPCVSQLWKVVKGAKEVEGVDGEKVSVKKVEVPVKKVEVPIKKVEVPVKKVEVLVKKVEVPVKKVGKKSDGIDGEKVSVKKADRSTLKFSVKSGVADKVILISDMVTREELKKMIAEEVKRQLSK